MPATTSATMKQTIRTSPIVSRRASVSGPTTACEWPCPWEWWSCPLIRFERTPQRPLLRFAARALA